MTDPDDLEPDDDCREPDTFEGPADHGRHLDFVYDPGAGEY